MGFFAKRFGGIILKGNSVPQWVVPVCCMYCVFTIQTNVAYIKDPRAETARNPGKTSSQSRGTKPGRKALFSRKAVVSDATEIYVNVS